MCIISQEGNIKVLHTATAPSIGSEREIGINFFFKVALVLVGK